jgi:two-component system chemotaxis response regulator CheB
MTAERSQIMEATRIIVVGASAGGLEALTALIAPLPKDFPAPVFIVQHLAADTTGQVLVETLQKSGKLNCKHPWHGERFVPGQIYVALPDHQMLVTKDRIIVSKGARENRSRPGIDPLFRSAAVAYGAKVNWSTPNRLPGRRHLWPPGYSTVWRHLYCAGSFGCCLS